MKFFHRFLLTYPQQKGKLMNFLMLILTLTMLSTAHGQQEDRGTDEVDSSFSSGNGWRVESISEENTTQSSMHNSFEGTADIQGSRVGPFYFFQSSANNAEVVNEAFKGRPLLRALGLAFGDEFPNLRDQIIQQTQSHSFSQDGSSTPSTLRKILPVLTNLNNWKYDHDNDRKETKNPYSRKSSIFFNVWRYLRGNQ